VTFVSDILTDAMQACNAYGTGQTPDAEDSQLALRWANRLLDSLSAEKLGILGIATVTIPLAGAAASYPLGALPQMVTAASAAAAAVLTVAASAGYYVGMRVALSGITQAGWNGSYLVTAIPGGTSITIGLNSTGLAAIVGGAPLVTPMRCMKIKAASVSAANTVDQPVAVVPAEKWRAIPDKTRTGIYIESLFWDAVFPVGALSVTPKPSAGNLLLEIYEQYPGFVNLTDVVVLPPGFELPLINLLALYLCVPFGRPVPPALPKMAADAKQTIQRLYAEVMGTSPPAQLAPPEEAAAQQPAAPAQAV